MAKVNQRMWKIPGQHTKRKAWGFTAQVPCNPCRRRRGETDEVLRPDGVRQVRSYKAEWTREDAETELAKLLLKVEEPKPVPAAGMTLAQAAERYLATKARKRSLAKDRLTLEHFKSVFGAETALADLTASRISEYRGERLAAVSTRRKDADGNPTRLSAASINRPLALLRHLLRLAHEEWEVLPAVPRIRLEKEPEGRIRWRTDYPSMFVSTDDLLADVASA